MNKKLLAIAISWIIFALLTLVLGAFREIVFIPATELNPNIARALLLPIAFFYLIGVTYLFLKKTKADYLKSDMLKVGTLWLFLTILFEFSFGGLVMGNSLDKLISDYNLFKGRTWSLFLLCVFFSPMIVNKLFLKKE